GELFDVKPLPPDFVIGNSTTEPHNGYSVGVVPGLEFKLDRSVALDVSGDFEYFNVGGVNFSPIGEPPSSSGSTWEGRIGVRWHPDDGTPSGVPRADAPPEKRDAWGVSRSYGWAAGEMLAINFVAAGFNEYGRNGNFNQISPRSWWANLDHGFTYDDNE